MKNEQYRELEVRRIRRAAKELRERGFDVVIEPKGSDLPEFLEGYSPDIIAIRGDEKLVIEVKSKASLPESKYLEHFAEVVQRQSGWSFEFIVTNPKQDQLYDEAESTIETITKKLLESKALLERNYFDAAFLLSWGVFESVARISLKNEQPAAQPQIPPSALIRQLFSYGILNKMDLNFLDKLLLKRNALVHGLFDKEPAILKIEVDRLITLAERLLGGFVDQAKPENSLGK